MPTLRMAAPLRVAVLPVNMQFSIVTIPVLASLQMAPPDVDAVLFVKVQFLIVGEELLLLIPPPSEPELFSMKAQLFVSVVEAGKTIIIDKPQTIELANKLGIAIIGLNI